MESSTIHPKGRVVTSRLGPAIKIRAWAWERPGSLVSQIMLWTGVGYPTIKDAESRGLIVIKPGKGGAVVYAVEDGE